MGDIKPGHRAVESLPTKAAVGEIQLHSVADWPFLEQRNRRESARNDGKWIEGMITGVGNGRFLRTHSGTTVRARYLGECPLLSGVKVNAAGVSSRFVCSGLHDPRRQQLQSQDLGLNERKRENITPNVSDSLSRDSSVGRAID